MLKKFVCFISAFAVFLTLAGCGGPAEPVNTETPSAPESSAPEPEAPKFAVNHLTGIRDVDFGKENNRPVAIMVDNDSLAQQYSQSGISDADIVYETETEGGITRLMAVFADVSKVEQIGDVRSARYVYTDLAMGHNALYVHHGRDEVYCGPHMSEIGIDNYVLDAANCGFRTTYGQVKNWQTLFTKGADLAQTLANNRKVTSDNIKPWQTFAAEDEKISFEQTALKISAPFSGSYKSYFTYDAGAGVYLKTSNKCENKDRNNQSHYKFKNVLILQADMSYYPNGRHRKIDLSSGSGYYAVNGTYQKIKWKKGNAKDKIVLTAADGTPLTMNAGNTWVCIIKNNATITIE